MPTQNFITRPGSQFIPEGTGAVERTVGSKLRDVVSVKDFGAVGDGVTDDTAAIQAAIDSVSAYGTLYFDGDRYKTNGVITFSTSNVNVHFDGTTFLVGDTGTSGTTVNGSTGKIGFHFKEADGIHVTGSVTFIGQGTPGSTSLLGVMFDNCDDVSCPAFMRFKNMAIGRNMTICARGAWGDAYGNTMWGLQPFESPPTSNAGTVDSVVGCTYCQFGDVHSVNGDKPARYLSIGIGAGDVSNCSFGSTFCQGRSGSLTAHALALRSAVDCTFGPVAAKDCQLGIYITQYPTDAAYSIDRVAIESLVGTYPSTGASVDAALEMSTTSSNPLGTVYVGSIDVTCAGEFAILHTSGTLNVGTAKLSGAAGRLLVVYASTGIATFNADKIIVSDSSAAGRSSLNIGKSGRFSAGLIDAVNGPAANATSVIRYDPAYGTGSLEPVSIGTVRYRQNGSVGNYFYVVYDDVNSFESWQIDHIDGVGSTGQALFGPTAFRITNSRISSGAIPTGGAYSQGAVLWNSNPSAGGTPGWVCVTAGTPGTWKAMASVAA